MSRGDINAFLKNLFQSEGGTNPKVVNPYGYIGKYQFGEDALIDLGYYKPDGTKNRTLTGKFKYDWSGEWTGKNGIASRDDFLESESVQDKAAKEWIKLLCSRSKRFKLQQYIGRTINSIEITESGIIAAAHLRGFGSAKSPGVRQFLASNGAVDPKDANGTPVSKYMRLFTNYDLACCGSVTAVLLDRDKNPITGLDYQIKIGNKVAAEGKTNSHGTTKKVEGLDAGANITILVKKLEGGFKEIKSFIAYEQTAFIATLRSATRMVTAQLEKHRGTAGDYKRYSEMEGRKKPASGLPVKTIRPEPVAVTLTNTTQARTEQFGHRTSTTAGTVNPSTTYGSKIETKAPSKTDIKSLDRVKESGNGVYEPHGDGDIGAAPQSLDQLLAVEPKRNQNGHPVAVAKPSEPSPSVADPSVQKLEEILMRNVNFGQKGQALSGPAAAEKSRKSETISPHKKAREDSLGQCYKYVKIALLASDKTKRYLGQEAAKNAGPELQKEGFRNLLDNPNHEFKSPYDAPVGAVIVYDVTDGTRWGHIEVRVSDGFASDYFSRRPRTTLSGKENESTMSGRNRKVSGIWAKD